MTEASDGRVGVIGLGLMGRPMALNLHRAGYGVVIHNRSLRPKLALAAAGLTPAESPRAVAQAADIVILMLLDTPAVDAVLHGPDGVLAGLRPGALVIDMGTTEVPATRRFADEARAAGGDYVDAPVSGGEVGAKDGTLTIMAGGSADAFARAKPVFAVLGRNVSHIGAVGAGQITKAANQLIVAVTIGAVAEALTLARAAGADPAKVRDALQGGFAASRILELHGKRMVDGNFKPGGRSVTQLKDLNQCADLAAESGVDLPTLALVRDLYRKLVDRGDGDLDHSALIRLIDGS
ncbi:MAG: NAD(P)-dependent oxidoreductase [Alphaproteobacteria bacterium]